MHGTLDVLKADPYLGVEEILCAKTCPFSVIFYCALCQSKIQNGTCKNLASIAGVRKDLCNRCGYRGLILVDLDGPNKNAHCFAGGFSVVTFLNTTDIRKVT